MTMGMQQTMRAARIVIEYQQKTGMPPTVREVGKMMELQSTSTVQHHLTEAVRRGWLMHAPGKGHAFRAPTNADAVLDVLRLTT